MKIRGVACDLEGTVIDVEKAHHEGHLAAAAKFGLPISLEEALHKLPHFIGGPDEKVCEDIRNLLDPATRKLVSVEEILSYDKRYYDQFLATMPIDMRAGFVRFFDEISLMGLKCAIGSLTPEHQALTLLERSLLDQIIGRNNIVLREHVERVKPAPDVFLKTAELMGIDPREQLVFEDSPRGVQAALAAGSKAVGMPVVIRGSTVGALVDAGASRIFFDWREINAQALIKNLSE